MTLFLAYLCLLQDQRPVPTLPADVPATAIISSIVIAGNLAGHRATWQTRDGKVHTFLEYNDRGRGPKLAITTVLDRNAIPIAVDISGNDYFKDTVDEHFACSDGKAEWHNKAENGSADQAGGKFYLSLDGDDTERLARALLEPGRALSLLPAGQATITKLREVEVDHQTVTLYAISGLDLTPTYVWLDAALQLFASGSTWSMTIRKGFEKSITTLAAAQEEESTKRTRDLAARITGHPAADLVFEHAAVFDSVTGTVRDDQCVVIRGNRIASVAVMTSERPAPGAQVINAKGKTLLPGLWDMHSHVQDSDPLLDIAAGVTTVRDLANDIDELAAKRKRFDSGEEIGPRIIPAGFIDGPGPYQGPTKILAATEDEARAYVRHYHELGYPQIKIYSSLKRELVPAIIDEAHKNGMRVSGHIPTTMTAEECIRLGLDEMQHMNFVFLNFMPDVQETRTPARFTEPAKRARTIDPKSPPVQAFLALLKQRGIVIDATLSIFEGMFTDRPGTMSASFAAVADRMPAQVRRGFTGGGLPVTGDDDALYRESFAQMKRMLKEMFDHGVRLVAGTDSFAGFALHRELEIYVEAGIPAPAVLQLATRGAAQVMRKDHELGVIAPGCLADVILVDGDPTRAISAIRNTQLVVKDGRVYRPNDIYQFLGIKQ